MTTLTEERIALIADLPLTVGSHSEPPPGSPPCGLCIMEKFAWITGQDWTDDPDNCSPVIGAFLRRYNDCTDQDGRDQIDKWVIANWERLVKTADDDRDYARGYIVADWAARTSLPLWLELAGATDAAQGLRALPEITDARSARAGRDAARASRVGLRDYWAWRIELQEKVRAAVVKALKGCATAATTTADAATIADAAAATTTATIAAATIAATIAATTTADAIITAVWSNVYDRVYKAVRARLAEVFAEQWAPAVVPMKASALVLLERLV
jgi:hypothetical protein